MSLLSRWDKSVSPVWLPMILGGAAMVAAAVLTHINPAVGQQGETLGPPSCTNANCHGDEASWWNGDPHKRTADAYLEGDEDFSQLALSVGVDPNSPGSINPACFNCHGTVLSGAETEEVEYGVSCESCHGPGSLYNDPHQESYQAGVQNGMADLRSLDVRAQMCVSCHLVTDQELLRVHPPGWTKSGKYTRGMKGIAGHWKEFTTEDKDGAPFDAVLAKQKVVIPPRAPSSNPVVRAVTDTPQQRPVAPAPVQRVVVQQISGPWLLLGPDKPKPVPIPAVATAPDSAAVPKKLTSLQARIAAVYAALDSVYGP